MLSFKDLQPKNNTALKQALASLLSSALLALIASSAQAVSNVNINLSQIDTLENPAHYCHNDVEAKTFHPNSQSLRQRTMDCMQTQLRSYQQLTMTKRQQYLAYKAQAWLNYAYHEDSMGSSTLAGNSALVEGATILQALQNGSDKTLSLTTDIPKTSALMRPDLWAILSALKDYAGFESAPRELAFSEVALVWAAADYCQLGSSQSGSNFRMADRWLEQAREAYVNTHDSQTNRALEDLTVSYYEQYAPLDAGENNCSGYSFNALSAAPNNNTVDKEVLSNNNLGRDNSLSNDTFYNSNANNSSAANDNNILNINIKRKITFAKIMTVPILADSYSLMD